MRLTFVKINPNFVAGKLGRPKESVLNWTSKAELMVFKSTNLNGPTNCNT